MPDTLTLEEIKKLNPHIDVRQIEDWRALGKAIRTNGLVGRSEKKRLTGRMGRARFDDTAQNESRTVRLRKF